MQPAVSSSNNSYLLGGKEREREIDMRAYYMYLPIISTSYLPLLQSGIYHIISFSPLQSLIKTARPHRKSQSYRKKEREKGKTKKKA